MPNWSGSAENQDNTWADSTLNTEVLNGTFLANLGTTWSDKIATTTWNVGGMDSAKIQSPSTVKDTYEYEVGANKSDTTYEAKVGLSYVSEYGYASDPSYWTIDLFHYGSTSGKDWMRLENAVYWTITRMSENSYYAFTVLSPGNVNGGNVSYDGCVRPTFNLVSSVKISRGQGTESDPFRIEV